MAEKKYLVVEKAIETGAYTKAELMAMCETDSDKVFESHLRFMRIRDKYAVPDDAGIYHMVTEEEWNARAEQLRAAQTTSAPKQTFTKEPTKKLDALFAAYDKKMEAVQKAQAAFNKADQMTQLKLDLANVNFNIAKLSIVQAKEKFAKEIGCTISRIDTLYDDKTLDAAMEGAAKAAKEANKGDSGAVQTGGTTGESSEGLAEALNA